jgi:hypothetical protein
MRGFISRAAKRMLAIVPRSVAPVEPRRTSSTLPESGEIGSPASASIGAKSAGATIRTSCPARRSP